MNPASVATNANPFRILHAVLLAALPAGVFAAASDRSPAGVPVLSVDAGGCSASEGSGVCVLTVRLSETSANPVSFSTSLQSATATAGSDFGSIAAGGQIDAGALTTTVEVPITADSFYEFDETFTLSIGAVQNATPTALTAGGTIVDDDPAPAFTLSNCVVTEGDSGTTPCNIQVNIASGAQRPLELEFHTNAPGNLLSPMLDGSLESPFVLNESVLFPTGSTLGAWQVESGDVELKSYLQWEPAHYRQSLDLHGTSPGTIGRDLLTQAGQRYLVSFALSGNPFCALAVTTLTASFGGQALGSFSFDSTGNTATDMGWRYEAVAVAAIGGSSRLRFASTTAGGCGPALDDFAVSPVGAASSGIDYQPAFNSFKNPVGLAVGVTAHTIVVNINGDSDAEGLEDFEVRVCIAGGDCRSAVAAIEDDDQGRLFGNGFE